MPKPQKIEAVKEIADRLKKAEGALLTEFRGLRVAEMKELRDALR
jgi:ribosomal protein L10